MPLKLPKQNEVRSESPLDISDTLEYCTFAKVGNFNTTVSKSIEDAKGPKLVFQLFQERRLSPVVIQLTAGEVSQLVYLFSLVQRSKCFCWYFLSK